MTITELRATRAALKLTQEALGVALGVHRITVWRWEAGRRKIPAPIAKLLGMMMKPLRGASDY